MFSHVPYSGSWLDEGECLTLGKQRKSIQDLLFLLSLSVNSVFQHLLDEVFPTNMGRTHNPF